MFLGGQREKQRFQESKPPIHCTAVIKKARKVRKMWEAYCSVAAEMGTKEPRSLCNCVPLYSQDPFTGWHTMHQGGEIKESPADESFEQPFPWMPQLTTARTHLQGFVGSLRSNFTFTASLSFLELFMVQVREARIHSCLTCHPADRWCESEVACGASTGKITFWSHWRWSPNQVMLERTGRKNKERLGCSCLFWGSLQFRRIIAFLSLPVLEPL